MPSTWTTCHMHDGDHAEVSIAAGCVNLKPKDREYPSVSLFLGNPTRAEMTAAAINGDYEKLRRLLDAASPAPSEAEGEIPRFLQAQPRTDKALTGSPDAWRG